MPAQYAKLLMKNDEILMNVAQCGLPPPCHAWSSVQKKFDGAFKFCHFRVLSIREGARGERRRATMTREA
jgi:hypothetical protein